MLTVSSVRISPRVEESRPSFHPHGGPATYVCQLPVHAAALPDYSQLDRRCVQFVPRLRVRWRRARPGTLGSTTFAAAAKLPSAVGNAAEYGGPGAPVLI